jgi:hypothetical protein
MTAEEKKIAKIKEILTGFYPGDHVRVTKMPPESSVAWNKDWVGLEGVYVKSYEGMYIKYSRMKGRISSVYFPTQDPMCTSKNGWLVENAQLELLE